MTTRGGTTSDGVRRGGGCGKKGALLGVCLALLLSAAGCGKGEQAPEVPDQSSFPVRYALDLMGEGYPLREPFTMMTVTRARRAGDLLGAGGLLVVHTHFTGGESGEYAAYDLACPYEWPGIVRLVPREDGSLEAVCPACGTVYDLTFGAGLPKEGKSRYPLWQYRIVRRGTILEITNEPMTY